MGIDAYEVNTGNGAAGAEATGADAPPSASTAPLAEQTLSPAATEAAIRKKPTVSHMLGEIAWLLGRSPTHKHLSMADLDWLVTPALASQQCRIFRAENRPIAVAFWAYLSDEAAERFAKGEGRVRPDEWKSGEHLWLIDLVVPFATNENKQVEILLAELINGPFDGQPALFRRRDPATGKMTVHRLAKKTENEAEVA